MDAKFHNSSIFKNPGWSVQNGNDVNTLLSLDSPVSTLPFLNGTKRKWNSSSSATSCTAISSAKNNDESSMNLKLGFSLGNEEKTFHNPKKINLQLSLSTGTSSVSDIDMYKRNKIGTSLFLGQIVKEIRPSLTTTAQISSVTCTSGIINQVRSSSNNNSIKICMFSGCDKGARGSSGLCISHGGGPRCQKVGCGNGAEGKSVFCKAHGGGRRCENLGCTKSAEGKTDFCIAHGGGKRCRQEGCVRAARGKSGLCIRHGGGKRCTYEGCSKSADGQFGLCISHGGGRRCRYPECTKGAQGSTPFCKAHGGGKRCTYEGCNKGAEGSTPFCKGHGGGKRCSFAGGGICPKSVHGGTLFCVAHGGGKRCKIPECTRSARGRTDFCVRHGGGKRCTYAGCGKSAQGRTDYCKAHRGLVEDKRVHGGGTLGGLVHENPSAEKMNFENTNVNLMNWKKFEAVSALPTSAPERRVHGGGSFMALLSGLSEPVKIPSNCI